MRKTAFILAATLLCLQSCYKAERPVQNTLVETAKTWFTETVLPASRITRTGNPADTRVTGAKKVLWDQALVQNFRGRPAVSVPLEFAKDQFLKTSFGGNNYFRLDNVAHLLLYTDSLTGWHAELITELPDTAYLKSAFDASFSGLVLVEDWWGNPLHKFLFAGDGAIKQPVTLSEGGTSALRATVADPIPNAWVETCYYMSGFNSSAGDPDGYYWLESLGCSYSDIGGDGGYYGPVGKAGGAGPPKYPLKQLLHMPPPSNPIVSITNYFQCFQNVPGAIYQATVCVNQPSPGSRNPWVIAPNTGSSSGGSPVDVGHTFLVLTEIIPGDNGPTTITRNVGFYPASATTPFSSGVQGVLNNDESHEFNVSGAFTINGATLFFSILNYVSQGNNSGYLYNINSNNCTTFAIDALAAGHIYLPSTIGSWLGGLGNDPGDLGEDLRTNSFTGMTRSIVEHPHPNVGQCN